MRGLFQRSFRAVAGLFQFIMVVAVALFDYLFRCAFQGGNSLSAARALWLRRHSRRALSIFKLRMRVEGPIPCRGLLVSNHLSYLDILVISSITPAVFVAKRDVKFWPLVGWLAQMAGSLFVDRERRTQVDEVNRTIQRALDSGLLVVLFPEGTSSDGSNILPFKSALLEPAFHGSHPLAIGFIEYAMDNGDTASEICYWGDHTFFPHLLNLLSKRAFSVVVQFAPFTRPTSDRKRLAQLLHAEIAGLKENSIIKNCGMDTLGASGKSSSKALLQDYE